MILKKNIMEDSVCWIDTKEINLFQFLEEKDGKDLKKNFETLVQNFVKITELSEQLKNCMSCYNMCKKYNNINSSYGALTIARTTIREIFINFRHFLINDKDSYNLYYNVIKIILDNKEELLKKIESKEYELDEELKKKGINLKDLENDDNFRKIMAKSSNVGDVYSFKNNFQDLLNLLEKFKIDYFDDTNKNYITLKKGTSLYNIKTLSTGVAHLLDLDKKENKEKLILYTISITEAYDKNIVVCLDIFKKLFEDLYKGIYNIAFDTKNTKNQVSYLDTIFFNNAKIGLIYKNEILKKYFEDLTDYKINKIQQDNITTLTEYEKGRIDMFEEIYNVLMNEKTYNKLM